MRRLALLLIACALLAAIAFTMAARAQSVGNVGRVGVLMGPVGDGGTAGGLPAGTITTEGGEGITTESGQYLTIE